MTTVGRWSAGGLAADGRCSARTAVSDRVSSAGGRGSGCLACARGRCHGGAAESVAAEAGAGESIARFAGGAAGLPRAARRLRRSAVPRVRARRRPTVAGRRRFPYPRRCRSVRSVNSPTAPHMCPTRRRTRFPARRSRLPRPVHPAPRRCVRWLTVCRRHRGSSSEHPSSVFPLCAPGGRRSGLHRRRR